MNVRSFVRPPNSPNAIVNGLVILLLAGAAPLPAVCQDITINGKADGYRGIWYQNQPLKSEYKFKYSGGLGTYCAKHKPFAVYCPKVRKTFFCYGGVPANYQKRPELTAGGIGARKAKDALYHMVSYFDHETGRVPRPTLLLDKKTYDAHDNPVISVDAKGHLWIFSTAHGNMRPSYVHRSVKPYDIDTFEQVAVLEKTGKGPQPITNFSYFQAWNLGDQGFVYFFTVYRSCNARVTYFSSSTDGVTWTPFVQLADIGQGHYQVSGVHGKKAATSFNYHPKKKGLNWRTNLYYMETPDKGKTWQTADGTPLTLPLKAIDTPARIHDYEADGLLVYMKDISFDAQGRPIILFMTSKGYESGPKNDPRTWRIARWSGATWLLHTVTESDSNYDMGSVYVEPDGHWRIIAPTETGPQPHNPGGEIAMWVSRDDGKTWQKQKQMTHNSPHNHTYVRRPVNAHPDFYGLWADGHGRKPSLSRLFFCNKNGDVFQLPEKMDGEFHKPAVFKP